MIVNIVNVNSDTNPDTYTKLIIDLIELFMSYLFICY